MSGLRDTIDDIDYVLPVEAIAQTPVVPRDSARLLVDHGDSVTHAVFTDLPNILTPGDLVVVNNTRVFPARLPIRRATGGKGEVLLLEQHHDGWWQALVRPSAKLAPGSLVTANGLGVEIGSDLGEGRRLVRLDPGDRGLFEALSEVALVPLPPYINNPIADPDRYQTVFADRPLSVAAPTASLHFTHDVLRELAARGIEIATIELAVGVDTFRPVMVERLDDHEMHSEWYRIPPPTMAAVLAANRVVAVGTTVVRALESWAATGVAEGRSDLFIRPGHDWRIVDVVLTNFHLPRSTLLCLVGAFVGERWRQLYGSALSEGYRFLSFGDAMLLTRRLRHS